MLEGVDFFYTRAGFYPLDSNTLSIMKSSSMALERDNSITVELLRDEWWWLEG